MFSGIRLCLMIAAGAALVGLAFYGKSELKKANERDAAVSTLAAERHNHAVEISHVKEEAAAALAAIAANLKKAEVSSNAYQKDLAVLNAQRNEPLSVRVCRSAKPVPAPSSAPGGSDAASTASNAEAAQTDIGPALIEYGLTCEANGLQLTRLQEWVRAR